MEKYYIFAVKLEETLLFTHKQIIITMKKILSLMMSLLCLCAWAKTSSLVFTKMADGVGRADDGATWTIKSDAFEEGYDDVCGIQYGSNKSSVRYLEFNTSEIKGTVTSVVVNTRDVQETATVSVTVGDTPFTCSGSTTATNTSADYSFSGTGSGTILVRIDRGERMTNAIFVKSIIVTYRDEDETVITVNPDFGEYESAQTVFVTVENMPKDAVIVYNFVTSSPKGPEWQEYDDTKGISVEQSGLLTVAVNDAHGEEITSIEGEYVIKGVATGIEAISGKAVAGVRYYNVAGMASDKAFDGVNIVVTTYTDGTQVVTKVVK